jgi:hypothetical protein
VQEGNTATAQSDGLHLINVKVIQDRQYVVGNLAKREGARRIRGSPMATHIRGYQLVSGRCARLEDVLPVWPGTHESVKPEERLTRTGSFDIQLDAVEL